MVESITKGTWVRTLGLGIVAVLLSSTLASAESSHEENMLTEAKTFACLLGEGKYSAAIDRFDPALAAKWDVDKLRTGWEPVRSLLGSFVGVDSAIVTDSSVAVVVCRFEKGTSDLKVAFDSAGRVRNFFVETHLSPPAQSPDSKELGIWPWGLALAIIGLAACGIAIYHCRHGKGAKHGICEPSSLRTRVMPIVIGLCTIFLAPMVLGILAGKAKLAKANTNQRQEIALETLFGGFLQPVRQGSVEAIGTVAMIVFAVNLFGNVTGFSLPGVLVIPAFAWLGYNGWSIGVSLAMMRASSLGSIIWFLAMASMEWMTYVMAATVGVHTGLAVLRPSRMGESSRWRAFVRASRDGACVYGVIILLLVVQAVTEVFYVREVLLHGHSAIPLEPY